MSILNGFAMLNQSIRQIRTDRQQHDERMAGIKLQRDKLDAEMNDPRRKLARMQAARQLEDVPIKYSLGEFDNDRDREFFNRYTKGEIVGVLADEGMELADDGRIVDQGTDSVATRPRYVTQALANKLALVTQASRLGHSELDMDIDRLSEELVADKKKYPASGKHPKDKMYGLQTRMKEEKLAKLVAQRDDPNQQYTRLVDTSKRITDMQLAAMSDPNIGDEVYKRLDLIQTHTNDQIKALLSKGVDSKNVKAVTYSYQDPNTGQIYEQTKYLPWQQANNAPQSYTIGGKTYTRNSIKNAADVATGDKFADITPAKWQLINTKFAQNYDKFLAAALASKQEGRVRQILETSSGTEEVERLMDLISQDSDAVEQNWYQAIAADMANFKDAPGFAPNLTKKAKKQAQPSGGIDVSAMEADLAAQFGKR